MFLRRNGQNDISAQSMTRFSSSQITCKFNLSGKTLGEWDIVVQNPWRWPKVNYEYELHNAFEIKELAAQDPDDGVTEIGKIEDSYLYPNVIRGEREISIEKIPVKVKINIYDRIGNKLKEVEVGYQNNKIDISDLGLTTGIYYVIAEDIATGDTKVLKFLFVK